MILDEVGAWVNLNSEAIYGSKPWKVYGDNLNSIIQELRKKKNPSETDLEALKNLEGGKNEQFNERTLNPIAGEIRLPVLGLKSEYDPGQIKTIQMLGGDCSVRFEQDAEEVVMDIPALRPNRYATVFKVIFKKN